MNSRLISSFLWPVAFGLHSLVTGILNAQTPTQSAIPVTADKFLGASTPNAAKTPASPPNDYKLGPGDQISITVPNLDTEFANKAFRLDLSGDVTIPFAGRFHAAGFTAPEFEAEMRTRLSRILKDPEVVITLTSFGSEPVSVLGAVNSPGIQQIGGGKSLFEVLSMAGGLTVDAGYLIRIRRDKQQGIIPLPTAQIDPDGRTSSASVHAKNIMRAAGTEENIPILPGDSISVPFAEVVYAVGSVTKSGGFPLNEHETLSALQVLALAQGLQRTAASDRAEIVRIVEGSTDRLEIPVNLKLLLTGKGTDVPLRAGDILFVPSSAAKNAGYRTIDTITGMAGAALIVAR
jgi:polysaccharide export outer membrane protein